MKRKVATVSAKTRDVDFAAEFVQKRKRKWLLCRLRVGNSLSLLQQSNTCRRCQKIVSRGFSTTGNAFPASELLYQHAFVLQRAVKKVQFRPLGAPESPDFDPRGLSRLLHGHRSLVRHQRRSPSQLLGRAGGGAVSMCGSLKKLAWPTGNGETVERNGRAGLLAFDGRWEGRSGRERGMCWLGTKVRFLPEATDVTWLVQSGQMASWPRQAGTVQLIVMRV